MQKKEKPRRQRAAGQRVAVPASAAKRARGRYFTVGNLFDTPHFGAWAAAAGLPHATLTEPFAGRGDLIAQLRRLNLCGNARAYDIAPAASDIARRDTLANFPRADVIVTNPPWLARNSATRRGLPYPQTPHDDLYKHCLHLCLQNAGHVAAIIPASFLCAGLFHERLTAVDIAAAPVFDDTDNPTCLALFEPQHSADVSLYHGGAPIGTLRDLERHLPRPTTRPQLRFNDPNGSLGLIAYDNTRTASIRFCAGEELRQYPILHSSRMITRIGGEFGKSVRILVQDLNDELAQFRHRTRDVFLTPFQGLRQDGHYRRRINFALARDLVSVCCE